jgi:hypothetical protein
LQGKIRDSDGVEFDRTKYKDLLHCGSIFPQGTPDRFSDLQTFCDEVLAKENRVNSRYFCSVRIALHNEEVFTLVDQIEIVRDFANEAFAKDGAGVVYAIHAGKPPTNNIHAHLLVTTRGLDKNSFVRKKDENNIFRKRELL